MGEPWMIPTKDQAQKLIDNTYFEWTTINNVNGIKFINKTNTSKYIFLPAAGLYWDRYNSVGIDYVGTYGYYWSNTYENTDRAHYINVKFIDIPYTSDSYREYGASVRGIRQLEW